MTDSDERLDKARRAIMGDGPLEDLLDVLRCGELDTAGQRLLAYAFDREADLTVIFERRDRTRGKGVRAEQSRREQRHARYAAGVEVVGRAYEDSPKQEARVAAAMERHGLSRASVMRGVREVMEQIEDLKNRGV